MTSEIFISLVKKLDKEMKKMNRKITRVFDNCPAHPSNPGLQSVELVFLPQNRTSKTQPMDQGIKVHYRKGLLLR